MQKAKEGYDTGDTQNVRDIEERTFAFAPRVVRLYQHLDRKPGAGRIIGQQILRVGTPIGTNIEEVQAGQSRADFISKNAIAPKESVKRITGFAYSAQPEFCLRSGCHNSRAKSRK